MPPDIDTLRLSAKRLIKAVRAGEEAALSRVRAHVPEPKEPQLADCLHTIAREAGYESWPKLKFAHEAAAMSRAQRAERLKLALYHGQKWVMEKLLRDDPDLPAHDLGLLVATYDVPGVRAAVERDTAAATRLVGVRSPILHLAFSKYCHMAQERQADMIAIADLLLANGADPNDGYPPEPGSQHRLSALYGALGHADNMALAQWLLDHGASPDDSESLYHATELGHHDGLKLLIRHNVTTSGTNALPRALDFDDPVAVRLLLEHGADPNEAVNGHPSGQPVDSIPALHQAARRWCSAEIASLLLDHGADPLTSWEGHTAYATACIFGNRPIAGLLDQEGHATPLSPTEKALAAIASGGPAPSLDKSALKGEDRHIATLLAFEPGKLGHLKSLIEAGYDPDWQDHMGLSPLHAACWSGLPDQVDYLLTLKPDLTRLNRYGGEALGTCLHGAEHCPQAASRDHIACARLLLEAGSELRRAEIDGCGVESMAVFLEDWQAQRQEVPE